MSNGPILPYLEPFLLKIKERGNDVALGVIEADVPNPLNEAAKRWPGHYIEITKLASTVSWDDAMTVHNFSKSILDSRVRDIFLTKKKCHSYINFLFIYPIL